METRARNFLTGGRDALTLGYFGAYFQRYDSCSGVCTYIRKHIKS